MGRWEKRYKKSQQIFVHSIFTTFSNKLFFYFSRIFFSIPTLSNLFPPSSPLTVPINDSRQWKRKREQSSFLAPTNCLADWLRLLSFFERGGWEEKGKYLVKRRERREGRMFEGKSSNSEKMAKNKGNASAVLQSHCSSCTRQKRI